MTDWSLTDADMWDVPLLAGMIGDWVRETGWMPVLHSREEDECFVAGLLQTHVVRVARRSTDRLAFLARQGGKVQALHVASAARGQGIGRALLDEVKAVEAKVELWTFQANARALAFYERAEFHEAKRTDGIGNDEGLPDVCLIWSKVP